MVFFFKKTSTIEEGTEIASEIGGEVSRSRRMVKAVVSDEAQIKAFEEALTSSSLQAQVGLVVGKLSAFSDRALVYSLLPTPPTDADVPACSLCAAPKSKPTKGKGSQDASLEFDVDWIAEHASQVSRMLLGGMNIIGIYIWASEASFKATSPAVLSLVVRAVSQAWYGSTFSERLLIYISYSPRRWACRICDIASGSLRPCDFKYSKLLASLQTFKCTYNFEIRLTVFQPEPFKKVVLRAIDHLTEEVQAARALIDGDMFSQDLNLSSEDPHRVDFLVSFKNAMPVEECSLEGVAGLLLFTGSVSALAYLGQKESVSEAISDLKADIIRSLRSRLDIILDEEDDELNNNLGRPASQKATQIEFHELREPFSFSFPRRALIPWLAGTYVCDYLQQSETPEDAIERCKEVISLETAVKSTSILEPERTEVSAILESFWDMVPGASRSPGSMVDTQKSTSNRTQCSKGSIVATLLALLIAVMVGFVINFSASWKT